MARHRTMVDTVLRAIGTGAILAAWLAASFAAPAHSQSPGDRLALASLADSLGELSTPEGVASVSERWQDSRPKAMTELRRGLLQWRLGQLTGEQDHYEKAIKEFDRASRRESDWPWPWYGLGTVRLEMWDKEFPVRGVTQQDQMVREDRYLRAGYRDLGYSLQRDSLFQPSLERLLDGSAGSKGRKEVKRALELSRLAEVAVPAETYLALSYEHMRHDRLPAAAEELGSYLMMGGDSGVAALTRARFMAWSQDWQGASREYFRGLAVSGVRGRELYRSDFATVATTAELRSFDSVPSPDLPKWVAASWHRRDALSLRPLGSRLAEHFRRWTYAVREYWSELGPSVWWEGPGVIGSITPDSSFGNSPAITASPNPGAVSLDHRGLLYLRHGEPEHRIWASGSGYEPRRLPLGDNADALEQLYYRRRRALEEGRSLNQPGTVVSLGSGGTTVPAYRPTTAEAWIYRVRGEDRAVHFAVGSQQSYSLSASIPRSDRYILGVARFDPSYYGLWGRSERDNFGMVAVPFGSGAREMTYRERYHTEVLLVMNSDSYPREFQHELAARIQAAALPLPQGNRSVMIVTYAVPAEQLLKNPTVGGTAVVNLLVGAYELSGNVPLVKETSFEGRFSERDGTVNGYLTLPVLPGRYQLAAGIQLPDSTAGVAAELNGQVGVPPLQGRLQISDIILGHRNSMVSWRHPLGVIPLNPTGVFRPDEQLEMSYVVTGMSAGQSYGTTVELTADEGVSDVLSVNFSEQAESAMSLERRTITLRGLEPGDYRLTLIIRQEQTPRETVSIKSTSVTVVD